MSRIYEAMKKAGLEHVGTETKELEPLLLDSLRQTPVEKVTVAAVETLPPLAEAPVQAEAVSLSFADLQARCAHPLWNPDVNLDVFSNPALTFGAEQFRTLRSRLYQSRSSQPLRTILVTSSVAGEGKTFVANNLAQAIVRQPDCRVLLIDADLRCSKLHLMLGAPAGPGLSDYLKGVADECAVIQSEPENKLCFVAAGTKVTNPSELLSNGRLRTLLDRVGPAFDWVIVDSPPHLPLADASVIADLCDGVLLVARAGFTPGQIAQRAGQELQARKSVLGVVLNAGDEASAAYELYEQRRQAEHTAESTGDASNDTSGSGLFRISRRKKKDG